MNNRSALSVSFSVLLLALPSCRVPVTSFRIGYETNLACAPALLGIARNDFHEKTSLPVKPLAFNAGPGVVEALFEGKIDFAYLDPVSAVSAYVRSRGKFVIVAGASYGGGALVAARDLPVPGIAGLLEGRVATPQTAGASDVEARHFFSGKGFVSREQGGGLQIIPIANLDIARVLRNKSVSAAWTVEPWVSELEDVADGVRLVNQSDLLEPAGLKSDPACVVVVRRKLLKSNPDLVVSFLRAHVALVNDIASDRNGSRALAGEALTRATGRAFGHAVLARAWSRLSFSTEIPSQAVTQRAFDAFRIGYMGASMPDLQPAFVDGPLKAVSGSAL